MTDKRTSLGLYGTGRHVRSTFDILLQEGMIRLEVQDAASGVNKRTAAIELSPDRLMLIGLALVKLGNGTPLDDIDSNGWNRIGSVQT